MQTHTRVCARARTFKPLPMYACATRAPKLCERNIYIYIYIYSFKFVWNKSRIIWELPHTPILPLYKAIKDTFSERGEYTQDWLKNSESKREFFTKHSQVMFCLLGSYFGLGLWVLKLTNLLVFLLVRLIEGKSNQSLKSSCVEVNVLTLALHFLSLLFFILFFIFCCCCLHVLLLLQCLC